VRVVEEKGAKRSQKGRRGGDPGRALGDHPDKGGPVVVKNGRYGPYASHDGVNATLPSHLTPETITLEEAVGLIEARSGRGGKKPAAKPRAAAPKAAAKPKADAKPKPRAPASKEPPRKSSDQSAAIECNCHLSASDSSHPTHAADSGAWSLRLAKAGVRAHIPTRKRVLLADFIFVTRPQTKPSLPSKDDLLAFIGQQSGKIGTRQIPRAF